MENKASNGVKFMLGTKGRMTQVFDDKGVVSPATIISAGPLTVTQVKDVQKDGYKAVQVGFGTRKSSRTTKPMAGHFSAKGGSASGGQDLGPFQYLREYTAAEALERGATLDISMFTPGDIVTVSATSKGKGFQGVVKRHGFRGGPRSHGQKNKERAPGSISGAGRAGGRVAKGLRMAGRMGGDRITVKNLRVLQVDKASNTLLISGAIPGHPGTLIEIRG
ncbi:50S ribosomal protein L3 [Candidatus Kaiserbacteria bacterium]|nr:50S ribosomal protein L3 [Candidatus Kaiserbacteria bacterium]